MSSRPPRMDAQTRREEILEAATRVFAVGGYHGSTTEQIARAAGISQPYVIRIFTSKEALFVEVFDRICDQIERAFEGTDLVSASERFRRILGDRNIARVMMHGVVLGPESPVSERARNTLGRLFASIFERTEGDGALARDILSTGTLFALLLGIDVGPSDPPSEFDLLMQWSLGTPDDESVGGFRPDPTAFDNERKAKAASEIAKLGKAAPVPPPFRSLTK